jgi:RNA polymerase sigma factor (sigma-70 family)
MASIRSGAAWTQIQRLFGVGTVSGLTEYQLLQRYTDRRDEAAFSALVARHAPMVLGVCRRMLADPQDVEDAFQATFLVLVRKAKALRPHDAVGHWLHGVAYRVALRARSETTRRRSRERTVASVEDLAPAIGGEHPGPDFELRPLLDEELRRLPATYRAAVVLCYLDGQTHEEAARQLGWPVGTVKGRLARAKDLLRDRLTRRGLTLGAGGMAALMSRQAEASVPSEWVDATVSAASRVAAGKTTAGVVSASVAALVEGVVWTMMFNSLKLVAALAAATALASGAVAYARQDREQGTPAVDASGTTAARTGTPKIQSTPDTAPFAGESETQPDKPTTLTVNKDFPFGADVASGFNLAFESYRMGRLDEETVHHWSQRLADSETNPADPASRVKAARGHLKRMKDLEQLARVRPVDGPRDVPELAKLNAAYYRKEAEKTLKDAEGQPDRGVKATTPDGSTLKADRIDLIGNASGTLLVASKSGPGATVAGPEPGKDARSLAIRKKLDDALALNFPNDTPLEDVLKYLRENTKSQEFPKGVPIYVDPLGLQEAEKTLSSPVQIDLDGVPLRRTLQLMLAQIGLIYHVEDGMIYITSPSSEQTPLPPSTHEPSALMNLQMKAERGELNATERKEFIEMLKDRAEIERLLKNERVF